MKKVLLVDPGWNNRGATSGGGTQGNLGLEYIGAVAQAAGHEVTLLEPPLRPITEGEVVETSAGKDVVAMSFMAWNSEKAFELADRIRSDSPSTQFVAGGVGPSGMPQQVKGHFDTVIIGEGEEAFLQILETAEKGIVQARRNQQWTGLPYPLRDIEVMRNSRMRGIWPMPYESQIVTNMLYGRGCPNDCWFCSSPTIWQRKVVWRNPCSVADELEMLACSYGVNSVDFIDPTFNVSHQRAMALCEVLRDRRIGNYIRWTAMIDPAQSHQADELFTAMREAGCIKIGAGVEDPTESMRIKMTKSSSNIEACHASLEGASKAGLLVRAYLIIGVPGQTDVNIEAIREAMRTWPIDEPRISIFCPFPGTRAWNDLQDDIVDRNLANYDTNHQVIRSVWSNEQLSALHTDLMRGFYGGSNYHQRRSSRISKEPLFQTAYEQFEDSFLKPKGYI